MGRTSAAVKNRYSDKAYDHVRYIVPAGGKAVIRAAAADAGQSVTQYITQAVNARLTAEGRDPIRAYVAETSSGSCKPLSPEGKARAAETAGNREGGGSGGED